MHITIILAIRSISLGLGVWALGTLVVYGGFVNPWKEENIEEKDINAFPHFRTG